MITPKVVRWMTCCIAVVGFLGRLTGASVPYVAHFEDAIGPEWSSATVETGATNSLTRFTGRFSNQSQTLTLSDLAVGARYRVMFDLYVIDTWDGGANSTSGDVFRVAVDGAEVFRETFSNYNGDPPSNPQTFPGEPAGGRRHWGFNGSWLDAVYRDLQVTFMASNAVAAISFAGQGMEDVSNESWGVDNVRVTTAAGTSIYMTDLPADGSTNGVAIDSFLLGATEALDPAAATNAAHYELLMAGGNGQFGDGDDSAIGLAVTALTSWAVRIDTALKPLQPGRYRMRTLPGLIDARGQAISAFERTFVVAHPSPGQIENLDNGEPGKATVLLTGETPAGSRFFTALGAGVFSQINDYDYWRIDAEANDVLTLRVETDLGGTYPRIYLRNNQGQNLASQNGSQSGMGQVQNYTIGSPGDYYILVYTENRPSRYFLRIEQTRGPQVEVESNDQQSEATVLRLGISAGNYQGAVYGTLPRTDGGGDIYRLGVLNVGNAISATMIPTAGSALASGSVVLSVEGALGGSGVALATNATGILSYSVATNDIYFVRIAAADPQRSLAAQYRLQINITDGTPPMIAGSSVPAAGTAANSVIDRFSLDFSEEVAVDSVTNRVHYDLRASGADGQFDTADDPVYSVVNTSYQGGLSAGYSIPDGPLQTGSYRMTVRTTFKDRAGNALAGAYALFFQVSDLAPFLRETRDNGSMLSATSLSSAPAAVSDGSFLQTSSLSVGGRPHYMQTADLNGDGRLDLVIGRFEADDFQVAFGQGDGTFQTYTNYAVGDGALGAALGDFNGDGKLDLAISTYYANRLSIFIGQGGGAFVTGTNYAVGSRPYEVAMGDFNKDTRLDIAVACAEGDRVDVLLGQGDGTFAGPASYAAGDGPNSVAVADLDADGKLDLAVGNAGSHDALVLRGVGDGTFQAGGRFAVGATPRFIALGDMDGDGKLDLVSGNAGAQTVSVLRGLGNGAFTNRVDYATGGSDTYQVILADVNADNRLDVVATHYGNNRVTIHLNRGDGTLLSALNYEVPDGPLSVVARDFNGDSRIDLAIACHRDSRVAVLSGLRLEALAEDPASSGLRSGYGRGNAANRDDYDYWSFHADEGDWLTVASETPGSPGESQLLYEIWQPNGSRLTYFYPDYNGRGQCSPVRIPVSGRYAVSVRYHYDYQSEYRVRVTLARPALQPETEDNNNTDQANLINWTLDSRHLRATRAGYIGLNDGSGDYTWLGNLTGGTAIQTGLRRPSTSGLQAVIGIYRGSALVTNSAAGAAAFTYTIPEGADGLYYVRVTADGGTLGLLSQYLLDLDLYDTRPPAVVEVTLPAEGVSTNLLVDRFQIVFSEEMMVTAVTNRSHYEMRSAGADGQFGTPDDPLYAVVEQGYARGLTGDYRLPDGPLQPGAYRFTIRTELRDRAGNALTTAYVRSFSVAGIEGYIVENRENGGLRTATSLGEPAAGQAAGTMINVATLAVGSRPHSIIAAELNGDSHLDLVIPNNTSGTLSVLLGDGEGGFVLRTNHPVAGAIHMAAGDFNGDNRADLAAVNHQAGRIIILVGIGDGTYQTATDYAVGGHPFGVRAADFNRDSRLDIVVANIDSDSVSVLLGLGDGTFSPAASYAVGDGPYDVRVADLNKDGLLDLVTGNHLGDSASVLLGNGDGTFQSAAAYPAGDGSLGVAVGDVDGDTWPDVVTANYNAHTVSILPALGNGAFGAAQTLATDRNNPYFVELADLNGDQRPDLIVPCFNSDRLSVRLNRGSNSWEPTMLYGVGNNPICAALGDWNEDGITDVAVVNYGSDSVSVLLGDRAEPLLEDPAGSGVRSGFGRGNAASRDDYDFWSFSGNAGDWLSVASEVPGNPGATQLFYDILQPNGERLTYFYPDYAGWGQSTPVQLPISGRYTLYVRYNYDYQGEYRLRATLIPSSVQPERENNNNINEANQPQLVLTNAHQLAAVWGYISAGDGNGDYFLLGNLTAKTAIQIGLTRPASSGLTPMLSLYRGSEAVTNLAAGETSLIYSIPLGADGTYYVRVQAGTGTAGLRSQYLLGIDLADTEPPYVASVSLPAEGADSSSIIDRFSVQFSEDMNASTVTNEANYELREAGADQAFDTGDDWLYRVVNQGYTSGLSASYRIPDGPLQPGTYRLTIRATLIDRGGSPLTANYLRRFQVIEVPGYLMESRSNNGMSTATSLSGAPLAAPDGTLVHVGDFAMGRTPHFLASGDFNQDGSMDLAVPVYSDDQVSVLPGRGDGTFGPAVKFGAGDGPTDAAAADLNGDSRLDLVVANYESRTISVHLGQGDGTFVALTNYPADQTTYVVKLADLNHDGRWDAVAAAINADKVCVFLGQGDGTFAPAVKYDAGDGPHSVTVADLNGDTHPDLVVPDYQANTIAFLRGAGDGTFAAPVLIEASSQPISVAVLDYDGNGRLDLAVSQHNANTIGLYPGNGDGTFGPRTDLAADLARPYEIAAADFNADGRPDLAVANFGNNRLTLLMNQGGGTFGNVLHYGVASRSVGIEVADFNRDGRLDAAKANYDYESISVLLGNRVEIIPADPAGTGLRNAAGRGNMENTSDYDFWSFYGEAGQWLTVAIDTVGNPGASQLFIDILQPNGERLTYFYSDYAGWGQSAPVRLPVTGRYAFYVRHNYDYQGEYRVRVTLAPSVSQGLPVIVESENNDEPRPDRATPVSLAAEDGHRAGWAIGYLSAGDGADYYQLGNLTAGTTVDLRLALSAQSGLVPVLGLYKASGQWITNSPPGSNSLVYTLPSGADDAYYVRVLPAAPGAVYFDGGDDHIYMGNWTPGNRWTVEAWVRPSTAGDTVRRTIAGSASACADWGIVLYNGQFGVNTKPPGGCSIVYSSGIAPVPGTWYHVAATCDGVTARIYVNGELAQSGLVEPDYQATSGGVEIGGEVCCGGDNFPGLIQEVRIWDRALTIEDIQANAARVLAGNEPGLVGYWPLNDGYGSTALDRTALQRHGNLRSGASWVFTDLPALPHFELSADALRDGLYRQYKLRVDLSDLVPPAVTGVNLPASGAETADITDRFTIEFSEDMLVTTVTNRASYELVEAGPDGMFGTADDAVYTVDNTGYSTGLSTSCVVADGPLQPGSYRLTIRGLQDRAGNGLAAAFVRDFTVSDVPGYTLEDRDNDTAATATPLSQLQDGTGLILAGGRGKLAHSADADYWSLEGQTGQRLLLGIDVPGRPGGTQLRYRLFKPDGGQLLDYYPDHAGWGQAKLELPTNGVYTILVTRNYDYFGEYRLTMILADLPVVMEQEDNGALSKANAMEFVSVGQTRHAQAAGYIRFNNDLDYYSLGRLTNGSTLFVNARLPALSGLTPVVSVYDAAGNYQVEVGTGRSGDGVAEVRILQDGDYAVVVRGSENAGDLLDQYLLEVQVLPTGSVTFPNLQVTAIGLPPGGLYSGQPASFTFTVKNVGSETTPASAWTDRVVLSANTVLGDADDHVLAILPRQGQLGPNASYDVSHTAALPDGVSGPLRLIVQTDLGNAVAEFLFEADNVLVTDSTFEVRLADYPDLRIENAVLAGPADQVYRMTWATANRGAAPVLTGWAEQIEVRNADTGGVLTNCEWQVAGPLPVGGTAGGAADLIIPAAGRYRITLAADARGQVFEFNELGREAAELNNVFVTNLLASLDLRVLELSLDPAGAVQSGDSLAVRWTDRNEGVYPAAQSWMDRIRVVNTTSGELLLEHLVPYDVNALGVLGAGQSRAREFTLRLPDGPRSLGILQVTVLVDAHGAIAEFNAEGSAEANNSASRSVTGTLAPYPDLAVLEVRVPASGIAGQSVEVSWVLTNQGTAVATGPWQDAVALSADGQAGEDVQSGVLGCDCVLEVGQFLVRTQQVLLPPGASGDRYLVVAADAGGAVPEGYQETNNTAVSSKPIRVLSPDLEAVSVAFSGNPVFGGSILVSWTVRNRGTAPATASWVDRVYLSPDGTLNNAIVLGTEASGASSPLATNTAYQRSVSMTLPVGATLPSGTYYLVVHADADGRQPESSEANNIRASAALSVSQPPLPDLAVAGITIPGFGLPGQTVDFIWGVTNRGSAAAMAPWTETISLSPDPMQGNDILVGTLTITNSLPAGEWLVRTQSVVLPLTGVGGNVYVVVALDTGLEVAEQSDANNVALATEVIQVPASLSLEASATEIAENAAQKTIRCRIIRSGNLAQAVTVSITNSHPDRLTSPASVAIPPWQVSASFDLTVVANGVVDGSQEVTVGLTAPGYIGDSKRVTVVDTDLPGLQVQVFGATVVEGQSLTASVSRGMAGSEPLVVFLSSANPSQLQAPASVVIPTNAASVTFDLSSPEDAAVEAPAAVNVRAYATGYNDGAAAVTVVDNDIPEIHVAIETARVSEGDGPQAAVGTVVRSPVGGQRLVVDLESSHAAWLAVPARVVIPAAQASVRFNIEAIDNDQVDGNRNVTIRAFVVDAASASRLAEGVPDSLEVADDDGPTLKLTLDRSMVSEGILIATRGTVIRNLVTGDPLAVQLTSSDTTEATAPATVTIPAGQASATFNVQSVQDGFADGNQTAILTAAAPGYTSGQTALVVSDVDLPDLVIARVTVPAQGTTDGAIDMAYRIENQGRTAASGTILQRVFLSKDSVYGPDDSLLGQYSFTGDLAVGDYFEQTLPFYMPRSPGNYWLVVVADAGEAIAEIVEDNNSKVSASSIQVNPSYTATVQTDLQAAMSGTPVPMYGQATKAAGGPAAFELVNIHVLVRDTRRIVSALTDAGGRFTATFQPLPGEAGHYRIGAAHPGVTEAPVQDQFDLMGMRANPAQVSRHLIGLGSIADAIQIENLSDIPLTGIQAQAVGAINLQVSLQMTNVLAGQSAAALSCTLQSLADQGQLLFFQLRLTSSEGVTLEIPMSIRVEPRRPNLAVTPSSLVSGMVRGEQTLLELQVVNSGGAASGPLEVTLPEIPWMHVVSTNPIPDLAPGETNIVLLQLLPPSDLAIGEYNGNLAIVGNNLGVAVPFRFKNVSSAIGDLRIVTVDERSYYGENPTNLAGATITVRDPFNGAVVAGGQSDSNGVFVASGLREGRYNYEAVARQHDTTTGVIDVRPGETNEATVFLRTQLVTYTWTVEEIEIEDRTKITLETVFETTVPTPVVTVEPNMIDLAQVQGAEAQYDLKVTNHGLIAARDVKLHFEDHPLWTITPLIREIGTLPAKSTLTIPVKVRRTVLPGIEAAAGAPCVIGARLDWVLICGPLGITYPVPIVVLNASGDCYGQTGIYTPPMYGDPSPGGGTGPGSGPGVTFWSAPPSYSKTNNCACDAKTFKKECIQGDAGIGVEIKGAIASAVSAALPPYLKLQGIAVNFQGSGQLCTCCEAGVKGLQAQLEAGISVEIKALVGFEPGFSGSANVSPIGELEFEAKFIAGLEITLYGSLKGSLQTECNLKNPKFCVTGQIGLKFTPQLTGKATFKAKSEAYAGYEGEGVAMAALETGVNITVQGCNDGKGVSAKGCVEDLVFKAQLTGSIKKGTNSITVGPSYTKVLAEGGCWPKDPSAAMASGTPLEPSADDPLDAHRVARWFGYSSPADMVRDLTGATEVDLADNASAEDLSQAILRASEAPRTASRRRVTYEVRPAVPASAMPTVHAAAGDPGVCAQVKLQIEQEAVLTRKAIGATLEIFNQSDTFPLENLNVTISIYGPDGNLANDKFVILDPELSAIQVVGPDPVLDTNEMTFPRVAWRMEANSTGRARWVILPLDSAAPDEPLIYSVGGVFTYTSGGVPSAARLEPGPVRVYPNAKLRLKYFHERAVYSDDPFTDELEPAQPFSLAVMVENFGRGLAKNFSITSAQPKIIENEKGLLIDFDIIATEVAGQSMVPTLTAVFGDLNGGDIKIARWLLKASLLGFFVDYKATFEHEDSLGGRATSLIDSVEIHEMIRLVEAPAPWADGRPDFLVNDIQDSQYLPDVIYLSDGTTNLVAAVTEGTVDAPPTAGDLAVQLTAPLPAGWAYLRIPDPANGQFKLVRVARSDGIEIPVPTNAWITDYTFVRPGQRPVKEKVLHILDHASTQRYTLTYAPLDQPGAGAPQSLVMPLPAASAAQFAVRWGGQAAGNKEIAYYDIYVSANDGPFVPWLQRSRLTSALYEGQLGSQYAFYSVATDTDNQRETAPIQPDAQTQVSLENTAPVLPALPDIELTEGDVLQVDAAAADADLPANVLSYRLGLDAPSGAIIHPTTGQIAWNTGEAHGGSTNSITVTVIDNGFPQKTDTRTFRVIVRESNRAPEFVPMGTQKINWGDTLVLTLQATDGDLPANRLTYAWAAQPPSGATLDPQTAVFTWKPALDQAPSTNAIAVQATDDGQPPLSATNWFTVVVEKVNRAPILSVPSDRTINEMTALVATNRAEDLDVPAQRMTFSLLNAPQGATIDPATGVVRWPPDETQGPSTNFFTVRVEDDGSPSASDTGTFVVVVREVNRAPVVTPVDNQFTGPNLTLVVTNTASDPDVPANTLRFSLGAGAPANAAIDTASGVFTWTPTVEQAPSANPITVIATDDGQPALWGQTTFTVFVGDYLTLRLGTNITYTGQWATVPVYLTTSAQLTNLTFRLDLPASRFTQVALQSLVPAQATAATQGGNTPSPRFSLQALAGRTFTTGLPVAQLRFMPIAGVPSEFVWLRPRELLAQTAVGIQVTNLAIEAGRLVVLDQEPLVEGLHGANRTVDLRVYGRAGTSCEIQFSANLANWTPWRRVPMSNIVQVLPAASTPGKMLFYRACKLEADPPILEIHRTPAQPPSLLLYGVPGQVYQLEYATRLATPAPWQSAGPITLTNAFLELPAMNTNDPVRFYRLRRP